MRIKGAIFDMDGTLVDSLMVWDVLWKKFGELFCGGRDFCPTAEQNKAVRTMTLEQAMEYIHVLYGIGGSGKELLAVTNRILENFYASEVQLKPGVRRFLEHCREQGVRMCIASATDRALLDVAIARCGIGEYFMAVLSCAEIGHGKDEPDIYRLALAALGTDVGETCVFEDSLTALRTADGLGMRTVGIFDPYNYGHAEMERLATVYLAQGETMEKLMDPSYL